MRRLAYLVLALILTLSVGLLAQPNRIDPFLSIPKAHAASVSIVLVGCVIASGSCHFVGWNGTTSNVNPKITVTQGDVVSIALSSGDGIGHEFQLDVDNDGGEAGDCGTTDPCSSSFPPSTTFMFTVTASPGTYTYYCIFHTTQMNGPFVVNPSTTVGGTVVSGINPLIVSEYVAIAAILLISVAAATVYVWRQRRNDSEEISQIE